MTTRTPAETLVSRYLADLDRALRSLAAPRRRQIMEEISAHIAEGRAELDGDDEAGVRALLDRVGDPELIAEEAGASAEPPRGSDAWVPWLLLVGGFLLVVGWFAGVLLLWTSHAWGLRDKLLGTFVLPGGLLGLVVLGGFPTSVGECSGTSTCVSSGFSLPFPLGIVLLLVALVAPLATAWHLDRIRRRS
ncbi:MAG TPA: hypothetical protein VMV12_04735 [Candidatus Micrarchaeaceae archaeon]|nr:hypothetical protein [Candidatus Micrarchaeaceae archaeon]